jgi:hypothetical protein
MPTTCWTIIHQGIAPVAGGATRILHAARHFVHPAIAAGARRPVRHAPAAAGRTVRWIELVCKAIPAALGGGLLIPQPANPPLPPESPPAILQPAPALSPWFPPAIFDPGSGFSSWSSSDLVVPSLSSAGPYPGPPTVARSAPEPSSAALLLGGLSGLLLSRQIIRRFSRSSGGVHPSPGSPDLLGSSPVSGTPTSPH